MEIEIRSKTLAGILASLLLLLTSPSLNSDSLSLTTYYPSPIGIYERLEVNGPLVLPSYSADPAGSEEGAVYFNASSKTVLYYNGAGWVPLTGSSAWTAVAMGSIPSSSGAAVKNANSGNIGVNTATPSHKLDINGDLWVTGEIKISGGFSSATPAPTTCQNKSFTGTAKYGDPSWLQPINLTCPSNSSLVFVNCNGDYYGPNFTGRAQSANPPTIGCCCFGKYMSAYGYAIRRKTAGLSVSCGPDSPLPPPDLGCGSGGVSGQYYLTIGCNVCAPGSTIP